jgi:serine/threonine-protein kinase
LLEPGQIFAVRYRIKRRIAEGGMGAIFEAEHTATERCVALKLLFPHIMSVASAREKFELEAKVSARVNSPYIVQVFDAGFDEATKSPYLVMELLSGETLATYVRDKGSLGVDEALRLLQQVATGLDAAHGYKEPNGASKPIVHRDLKPENLFVTRQHDGSSLVKILDFGIAKVLGDTANVSQEVRGTPLYMAFEQVTAGRLSPETDVWSLGLIAYYVLTGRRYWRSADQPGAGVQSLFAEILTLPMEAPSVRLKRQQVDIELPPAFDAWLLKCLDRDSSRRFHSAGAAVVELGRVFERAPRERSRPAPKLAPEISFGATETFQAPSTPNPQPSTAASLPAMATEHGSLPVRSTKSKAKQRLAAGVSGGVLLLAALLWSLAGSEPDAPGAGAAPASAALGGTLPDTVAEVAPAPVRSRVPPKPEVAAAEPEPASADQPALVGDAAIEEKIEETEAYENARQVIPPPETAREATPPAAKGDSLPRPDPPVSVPLPAPPTTPGVRAPEKPGNPGAASAPAKARVLAPSKPKAPAKPSAYDTR